MIHIDKSSLSWESTRSEGCQASIGDGRSDTFYQSALDQRYGITLNGDFSRDWYNSIIEAKAAFIGESVRWANGRSEKGWVNTRGVRTSKKTRYLGEFEIGIDGNSIVSAYQSGLNAKFDTIALAKGFVNALDADLPDDLNSRDVAFSLYGILDSIVKHPDMSHIKPEVTKLRLLLK